MAHQVGCPQAIYARKTLLDPVSLAFLPRVATLTGVRDTDRCKGLANRNGIYMGRIETSEHRNIVLHPKQ
jgi:hypothetical protein